MKLILTNPGESYAIRSYQAGHIVINDQAYSKSLVLAPKQLMTDWPPQSADELTEADFDMLKELRPDLVLLGTGEKQIFPPLSLYAPLLQKNIAVEVMNTGAACRTYNILASEGRQVIAALMMI
jgi:uncharacterized protein